MQLAPALLLAACTDGTSTAPDAVTLALADHAPTVVRVTWPLGGDLAPDRIEHRVEGGTWQAREVERADGGETLLVGLPPDTEVEVRLVAQTLHGEVAGPVGRIVTAPLDPDLPRFSVEAAAEGALDGGLLLTTNVQSPPAVLVFDGQGEVVWWRLMEDDVAWVGRARPSPSGESILVMPLNNEDSNHHDLLVLGLDGEVRESRPLQDTHHDFTVLPDGTLAFIVYDPVVVDTPDLPEPTPVNADKIVELSPDGRERVVWAVVDDFVFDTMENGAVVMPDSSWSHANALEYDPRTDDYQLSLLGLGGIASVDRPSGQLNWMFSGPHSDFLLDGETPNFVARQHGFQVLDDSLLVFQNGHSSDASSMAREFSFDPEEPVVAETWRYEADPSVYTPSLGSVIRLDSGNTVVDFATGGRLVEVMPDGDEVWRISSELGGAFGYAVWIPALQPGG